MTWCGKCLLPIMVAGLIAGYFTPMDTASAAEETVQMAFEKTMGERTAAASYTVRRGDRLLHILRKRSGGTLREQIQKLEEIRRLNPGITNVNLIYPGQKIVLPQGTRSTERKKDTQTSARFTVRKTREYTVKRRDSVVAILRRQLKISRTESLGLIDLMRQLNPGIEDMELIYPGQTLTIPVAGEFAEVPAAEVTEVPVRKEEPVSIEQDKLLPLVAKIAGLVGGTLIKEGVIYIPVRPSGQVTLDCAVIPLVEYRGGNKVFCDIQGQMPGKLKDVIETSWPGYSVLQLGKSDDILRSITHLVEATGSYAVEKVYSTQSVAGGLVTIPVDWLVVKRNAPGDDPGRIIFGMRFVKDRTELLPRNITDFAAREGFEVVEIEGGGGLAPGGENYGTAEGVSLKGNSIRELAASLLEKLGYHVQKDVKVQIFSIEKEGFNLSITADIETDVGGRRCLVVFDSLPDQFIEILSERNITVASLDGDRSRREVIEGVLGAAGISFVSDEFSFPFGVRKDAKGGAVTFRGIRIMQGQHAWCFVENQIDPALSGFLKKNGEVEIITY